MKYWFSKKRGSWKPISIEGWLVLIVFALIIGFVGYYFLTNYKGANLWLGLIASIGILIFLFNRLSIRKTKK
ncbi:MAG: hypothetical protein WC438_01720 [Candidatus Pacearchaeota archaeon]